MSSHEHYTELSAAAACAFAVSGQLTEQEGGEWIEHCAACPECRLLTRDFMQVSYQILPQADSANTSRKHVSAPQKAREHVSAVLSSGPRSMPGTLAVSRQKRSRVSAGIGVAALLMLIFGLGLLLGKRQATPELSQHVVSGDIQDSTEFAAQNRALLSENKRLEAQLQDARKQQENGHKPQQNVVARTDKEPKVDELNMRIATLERANTDLVSRDVQRSSEVAQLRKDLEAATADSQAQQSAARSTQAELAERVIENSRLSEQLTEARKFSTTLKRAQALVGGRKVHVWDVHDTDSNGKLLDAYARVVYVEGEGMDLYVYDLAHLESFNTQISFYVWGEKAGTRQPAMSLGILQLDDAKKNRWKLAFDDGSALAKINRIFVTAEVSKNNVAKPNGKEIISARLDSRTDHP